MPKGPVAESLVKKSLRKEAELRFRGRASKIKEIAKGRASSEELTKDLEHDLKICRKAEEFFSNPESSAQTEFSPEGFCNREEEFRFRIVEYTAEFDGNDTKLRKAVKACIGEESSLSP